MRSMSSGQTKKVSGGKVERSAGKGRSQALPAGRQGPRQYNASAENSDKMLN